MDLQPIYQAIQLIIDQQQKPSLALIKKHLKSSYPLPVLIKALKNYQQNNNVLQDTAITSKENSPNEPSVQELLARIEQLEEKHNQLLETIEELKQQTMLTHINSHYSSPK
ncbi:MAG: hypothetical protein CENE_00456 [Candidatus Celerinatantimonas neptuna]|nr:MAG: hypothetical protein CENE_00456 [Candidatus Celerinatantimonas neptuna]